MSTAKKFLHNFQLIPLPTLISGLKSKKLILGQGRDSLKVAMLTGDNEPKIAIVKDAQRRRKNHGASPVIEIVIFAN